jgi:hypothetical protein
MAGDSTVAGMTWKQAVGWRGTGGNLSYQIDSCVRLFGNIFKML